MGVQIRDPKATFIFRNAHQLPGGLTVGAGAKGFARPKEGTTLSVNRINDSFRKQKGSHGVNGGSLREPNEPGPHGHFG